MYYKNAAFFSDPKTGIIDAVTFFAYEREKIRETAQSIIDDHYNGAKLEWIIIEKVEEEDD